MGRGRYGGGGSHCDLSLPQPCLLPGGSFSLLRKHLGATVSSLQTVGSHSEPRCLAHASVNTVEAPAPEQRDAELCQGPHYSRVRTDNQGIEAGGSLSVISVG